MTRLINLPKITDIRGNLSFIESLQHIPFEIKRTYWIYDVPGGETRGGHAFREQEEFIVALSGSFDVIIDNGKEKQQFHLNRSYFGLYIPAGTWRSMENFSTNSLALVVASTLYDEKDYMRDYNEFLLFSNSFKQRKPVVLSNKSFVSKWNSKKTCVEDCQLIELDINHRDKGNITVVENQGVVPFNIERIYYLYDIPGGEERGGHAHKELHQLIIAAGGSFDVILDDGEKKRKVTLNRPYQGLKIVPGVWRELVNFSSGSICLVLASHHYDESDYLREYNEFIKMKLI